MTRREYELICRVLKRSGEVAWNWAPGAAHGAALETRGHIAKALCDAFELTGMARKLFLERAGVTATVTTSRN